MLNENSAVQVVASLTKEVYSDAVAPALREFGKIGADAMKTARLALFPLQYGAMFQDRLARRLKEAVERVPEARRIAPRESIALSVGERLRYENDGVNPIAELYVNLLARAMDKERVGEAHPAFVSIIGQLAPDELLVLRQLAEQEHRAYFRLCQGKAALLSSEAFMKLDNARFPRAFTEVLRHAAVLPEELAEPTLFLTFLEHLQSLGLAEYTNSPKERVDSISSPEFEYYFIKLTNFGRLFHGACILNTDGAVNS